MSRHRRQRRDRAEATGWFAVECPGCGIHLGTSRGLVGHAARCPDCGAAFLVPEAEREDEAPEDDPFRFTEPNEKPFSFTEPKEDAFRFTEPKAESARPLAPRQDWLPPTVAEPTAAVAPPARVRTAPAEPVVFAEPPPPSTRRHAAAAVADHPAAVAPAPPSSAPEPPATQAIDAVITEIAVQTAPVIDAPVIDAPVIAAPDIAAAVIDVPVLEPPPPAIDAAVIAGQVAPPLTVASGDLAFREPVKTIRSGGTVIELERLTEEERQARRGRRNLLLLLVGAGLLVALVVVLAKGIR